MRNSVLSHRLSSGGSHLGRMPMLCAASRRGQSAVRVVRPRTASLSDFLHSSPPWWLASPGDCRSFGSGLSLALITRSGA